MREFLAEVHHRAWIAAAVVGALAAACAFAQFALPAVLAAMTAGAILMWISEEENRLVAAMAPGADPMAAPVVAPVAAAPVASPVPAPDADRPSAVQVREWTNPFPASRPARRPHPQGHRAGQRRVAAMALSD